MFVQENVKAALYEDLQGHDDISARLIPETTMANAVMLTREEMIFCGKEFVREVFYQIDPEVKIEWQCQDGEHIVANNILYKLSGRAKSLLTGERTALNFVQFLSATATITHKYVTALGDTNTKLLDTRKTIPGLRFAQKYAVRCGGGSNHRMGLYDAFLIKENHIRACGSITQAVEKARVIKSDKKIEIEVTNLNEVQEALKAAADIIMLDNFTLEQMQQAVALNNKKAQLEVSGNVTLEKIAAIAETGVDFISVGALTKNIKAIDLSMQFIS